MQNSRYRMDRVFSWGMVALFRNSSIREVEMGDPVFKAVFDLNSEFQDTLACVRLLIIKSGLPKRTV